MLLYRFFTTLRPHCRIPNKRGRWAQIATNSAIAEKQAAQSAANESLTDARSV